jgi:hypothetical protein
MTALLNELKIPSLALAIFMSILSIARVNANYLSDLESTKRANAQPFNDNTLHLACGYQSDEPVITVEISDVMDEGD